MSARIRNICIIPARGGSKRIPNKNLINFCGKPLILHTIETAVASRLFGDHIYVSSDSPAILRLAARYGVRTVKRPKTISGDQATLEQAVLHVLAGADASAFSYCCLLLPTCPLRAVSDIVDSYKTLCASSAHALMSVVPYYWLKPMWALEKRGGTLKPFFHAKYFTNRHAAYRGDLVCPSGVVRWVRVKTFLQEKKFYSKNLMKYEVPFERSADIDTYEDLALAKKLRRISV